MISAIHQNRWRPRLVTWKNVLTMLLMCSLMPEMHLHLPEKH
nr:MAG TPA: hypothetical protein [Caudoviricetes sp.]